MSLTDTISTASVFAARKGAEVDGDREMVGVGAANLAAGLFQGFPVSTSGSRTAVAAQNGAKTQVTGLVGAAAILLLLIFAPGLLRDLPQPALAAVVIAASMSLADISGLRRLRRQRRSDFHLALAAFLGVAFLGVLPGIAIAVRLSILNVFRRAWRPHQAVLGRVEGMAGYHDSRFTPTTHHLPGLVIYRFDAPLFFANARTFRDQVRHLARTEPRPQWIVVAAEPITDVDTTAADILEDLDLELNADGISLVFAELKTPVRQKIERYELTETINPDHFFETITEAVEAFREQTGRQWTEGPGLFACVEQPQVQGRGRWVRHRPLQGGRVAGSRCAGGVERRVVRSPAARAGRGDRGARPLVRHRAAPAPTLGDRAGRDPALDRGPAAPRRAGRSLDRLRVRVAHAVHRLDHRDGTHP